MSLALTMVPFLISRLTRPSPTKRKPRNHENTRPAIFVRFALPGGFPDDPRQGVEPSPHTISPPSGLAVSSASLMPNPVRHARFERALDELSAASDRVWLVALTTGLG